MSVAPTSENLSQPAWEPESYNPPPTDLPDDDGEPLETKRHRTAMNVLIRSLDHAWAKRNDYFAGGNMFIYFSSEQARNRDFRGPDFFVVLGVDGSYSRRTWTVWEEEGRYPDVIVELMSSSTAEADLGAKKDIYERTFRTQYYFVFDPFDPNSLQGWRFNQNLCYEPLVHNEAGWLWCENLKLWLGTWEGTTEREPAVWLRFYNENHQLVLLPEEAAQQQAEQAQQHVETLEVLLNRYRERFGELPE